MILLVLLIVVGLAIIGIKLCDNDKLEELYATQGYTYLWNLLEDCTLVNESFLIMSIEIEQEDFTGGYFRYSIRFQDLGMCVISPQKYSIESIEQRIKSDYQSAVKKCKNGDWKTAVQKELNKANHIRSKLQQEADSIFFHELFSGRWFEGRDFFISSPFEYYASSGGSYIIDMDCWKIEDDNAVYTGLLEFESDQCKMVPYLIEETAKELFPNAKVSRYKRGCAIYIMLK